MKKVFISYHHENDQQDKEYLSQLAKYENVFEDCSVEVGDIDDNLSSEAIRQKIRDEFLRDTQVTILLCGTETKTRKHIDWELKSSMIDGKINKKSGILVINLPKTQCIVGYAPLPGEKKIVYGDYDGGWINIETRYECKKLYPYLPDRLIDNLLCPKVKISIVPWDRIKNWPNRLKFLIDETAEAGCTNEYDLSRPMRKINS